MAATVRAASKVSTETTVTSVSIAKPAGTVSGDLLIAFHWSAYDAATGASLTAPAGFTQVGATQATPAGQFNPVSKVWMKVAGGSEPATYSFGAQNNGATTIILLAIQGANTTTPIRVQPVWGSGAASASHVAPSIAASSGQVSGDLLLASAASDYYTPAADNSYTAPSGMFEEADISGSFGYSGAASQAITSTAATGTKTFTANRVSQDPWRAVSLVIAQGSSAATVQATAATAGAGALGAAAFQGRAVSRSLTGDSTFAATASQGRAVAADASAEGVLGASATVRLPAQVSGSAAGALLATAVRTHQASVSMVGTSGTNLSLSPSGAASLTGDGSLSASTRLTQLAVSGLSGSGQLDVNANQDQRVTAPTLTGLGALSADGRRVQQVTATFGALGLGTFDGRRVHPISGVLAGAGSLTAAPTLIHAARVSMGAFGTFQARPVSEVGGALNVSLYAVDRVSGRLTPLPDFESVTLSPALNEPGTLEVVYPSWGKNFNTLRNNITNDCDIEVEVWLSGRKSSAMRGILMDSSGDDVAEGATWSFSGSFLNHLMSEIVVYPQDTNDKKELLISSASAGKVIRTVVEQAQARGALQGLTLGFSDTVDSNGLPWVNNVTTKFSPGTTGLAVLDSLVGLGMVEWEITTDRVLKAYAPATNGIDRTLGDSPLVLRRGKQVPDAPRKHTVRESPTAMLAAGSEGIYQTAQDATAVSRRGRRIESFVSANNISDTSAVYGFAQVALNASSSGTMELTQGLEFTPGDPRPGAAYNVGDWVYADTRNKLERLRIKQWTLTIGRDGPSGSVTLNDIITDRSDKLARRLEALSNGTATVGTSTGEDTGVPVAPTGLTVGSLAYVGPTGEALATVTAGWDAVTLNTDGNLATDISGYNVQWRYDSGVVQSSFADAGSTETTQKVFGGVQAGQNIRVRVQTVDRSNNVSAWSEEITHTTATNSTPPPLTSTPIMDNFLGVLRITWDGLSSTGSQMPLNFDFVEVHISTSSSFTPTASTLIGTLNAKGTVVYTSDTYSSTYYARFVAVNTSGLKSTASGTANAKPDQAVGSDIFDGAIGTAKLADAAITTAKINDLAVNSAKISDLSVGKLTAGTFSASMTLSGTIQTALTGNRMLIDNSGWTAYNSGGSIFARLNVLNGTFLVTGQYQTALTGQRLVFNFASTEPHALRIYPSGSGDYARIFGRTSPSDGTAAVLIDGGAAAATGRGRLGAYRGEAFVSWVSSDDGGDSSSGYSLSAVSTNASNINIWSQNSVDFYKYSGASQIAMSHLYLTWVSGSGGSYCPLITANHVNVNSGIKFDSGKVLATFNEGTQFARVGAAGFDISSTRESKTEIRDIRQTLTPLEVIESARSRSYKYKADVEESGESAPVRFGPIAEELPPALTVDMPTPDGDVLGVSLSDQIGILWGAVNQLLDRRITSTTATCSIPAGQRIGAGLTVEVPCTWESSPLATPTDALVFVSTGLLGPGRFTAWVKPGSVTSSGCIVVFKNIGNGAFTVTPLAGLTNVSATVVGQALYTPPLNA